MLELMIACAAFVLLGALPPDERQSKVRTGTDGRSLTGQLASLRQVGLVRRR